MNKLLIEAENHMSCKRYDLAHNCILQLIRDERMTKGERTMWIEYVIVNFVLTVLFVFLLFLLMYWSN